MDAYYANFKKYYEYTAHEVDTNPNLYYPTFGFEFILEGRYIAAHIIKEKAIPQNKSKGIELVVRLFTNLKKVPKDFAVWFNKNRERFLLMIETQKWPDKKEGEQIQKVGPFMVHDSIGLSSEDMNDVVSLIANSVTKLHLTQAPNVMRIAYGPVYMVAQIQRRHWAAWYYPQTDLVYVRPKMKRMDATHAFIHELGHRYWSKFMSPNHKHLWVQYHSSLSRLGDDVKDWKSFEIGDDFPYKLKGLKDPYVLSYGATKDILLISDEDNHVPLYRVTKGPVKTEFVDLRDNKNIGYVKTHDMFKAKNVADKYPSKYAATDAQEHFCEAFSFMATGDLKEPNRTKYLEIINS